VVAIVYERLHETRVIPLDHRPHLSGRITGYMGDARGRWAGDTLIVETTNVKGSVRLTSAAGPNLRIVERFTRSPSGSLERSVTLDDPSAWTRQWTFSMPLRLVDDAQQPLEEACHEGNYPLGNMLSAARASGGGEQPR